MTRLIAFLFTIMVCALPAVGAERRYAFEEIELKNGLKVISLEDFSCPIVAVQVWYHVGSKDEDPERQGFAHMFEHMMFRGTDRLGPTDHFDYIRRVGGNCNAYTAFDQTVYVNELPSNQLELVLWLEAERMAFLKIDDESFNKERKVVEEERRLGLNAPYGTVPEKVLAELFHVHSYRWSPIGQIPHLRAATIDELQAFWDKYYVPNNATLVVVGAVKHADVQRLAKKYFEWIPRCPDPKRITIKEPKQTKATTLHIEEEKGPLPILGVVYRTAPEASEDQLPLEILMATLGGGESSRLYVDVVKDKKIAQVALAGSFALEQDGLCGAGGVLLPFGDKKGLMNAIREHIQNITDKPITDAELDKQKNQLRRGEVNGALTVASKAGLLGKYAVLEGDAERINRQLQEIDAVTAEDVQRVAKQYLAKSGRTTIVIEPSIGGMIKSLFKREGDEPSEDEKKPGDKDEKKENRVATRTGPKASAVRPEGFPEKPPMAGASDEFPDIAHMENRLTNGLRVVCVPNHEVPSATFTLGFKSGAWTEKKPGTASMTMGMLTQGTKTHNAKQMAETLERHAISLGGSAGMDTASVSGSSLLPQLDMAVELLADVVENPTFPQEEFDIMQKQIRMGLLLSSKTPEYLAELEFRHRLYGDHPYARTPMGELPDLDALTPDDLRAWWHDNIRPENAVLYFAGDIEPESAVAMAKKYLEGWKVDGEFHQPKLPEIARTGKTHIFLVDRPGSVQSQIRVGHLGITRKDPLNATSRVLGNIFGGGFNSRLNKAIRVDKGLTYGAGGGFSPSRFAGAFTISTFTKTPTTAETVKVILDEVKKIQSEPPTDQELSDTKSFITGSFPGQRETPQATVGDLWLIETEGLPQDYLKQYLSKVKSTTAEEVQNTAKKLIHPDDFVIIVVGEAKRIQEDLEKIAPVTLVGAPPVTPTPKKPEDKQTAS